MKEIIDKLKDINLKEDHKFFLNYNYDSIQLSKAFLFYYDKLKSKDDNLDKIFKDLDLVVLRRYVEEYPESLRHHRVRKKISRLIEDYKERMSVFVTLIQSGDKKIESLEDLKKRFMT